MILGVYPVYPWHQRWPCPPCLKSGILKYPHEGPPILDTLLIKISTQNFQGIFPWVKQSHPWYQVWTCPSSLLAGTLNIFQVLPWRTPHSWHTSNKDITTKLSGYLSWGQTRSSMTSRMTLSSRSPVRNHHCPPSTLIKERGFLTHYSLS